MVKEVMRREGVDSSRREDGYKWIGRKMGWGELETNKEWREFYMLNKMGWGGG